MLDFNIGRIVETDALDNVLQVIFVNALTSTFTTFSNGGFIKFHFLSLLVLLAFIAPCASVFLFAITAVPFFVRIYYNHFPTMRTSVTTKLCGYVKHYPIPSFSCLNSFLISMYLKNPSR